MFLYLLNDRPHLELGLVLISRSDDDAKPERASRITLAFSLNPAQQSSSSCFLPLSNVLFTASLFVLIQFYYTVGLRLDVTRQRRR